MIEFGSARREASDILNRLDASQGVILGHTAVISRKLHTVQPDNPDPVCIVSNADAGRVFYRRQRENEVVHIDVFHSVGELSHIKVTNSIRNAVRRYEIGQVANIGSSRHLSDELKYLLDHADIQTGTGGGRLTGSLKYGRKLSLRKAHANHCHLALELPSQHFAVLHYIVDAIEESILLQGLELRRINNIYHQSQDGSTLEDMSAYSDVSDSLLSEPGTGLSYLYQISPRSDADVATNLIENTHNVETLRQLIASSNGEWIYKDCDHTQIATLQKMVQFGFADRTEAGCVLTEEGSRFAVYLRQHTREVNSLLRRRLAQNKTMSQSGPSRVNYYEHNISYANPKTARSRRYTRDLSMGRSLAIERTVRNALMRHSQATLAQFRFTASDLMYHVRRHQPALAILLIIDGSASMKGARLKAAIAMAENLIMSSTGRVGAVLLQERNTNVVCPFTRNQARLRRALNQIQPYGLTPFSAGLEEACKYLQRTRTKCSWVIALTDGVPTLSTHGSDPLVEALDAAANVAALGLRFCCIGLEPNKFILQKITKAARGSLYVVDEMQADSLSRIVKRELGPRWEL